MKRFSIVIPAYNEENFIEATLLSLFPQTLDSNQYQIIIVNNNSTDKTQQVIEKFLEKNRATNIKIVVEEVKGIIPARRAGVEKAIELFGTSDHWIINADADARYSKEWLRNLHECIEENPGADFITSKATDDGTLAEYPNLMKYLSPTWEKAKEVIGSNGGKPVDDKVSAYSAKLYLDCGGYTREYDDSGVEQMAETWRLFIKATLLGYSRAFCTSNRVVHSGRRDKVHFLELETGGTLSSKLYQEDIRGDEENILVRLNDNPEEFITREVLEKIFLSKIQTKVWNFVLLTGLLELKGELHAPKLVRKVEDFIKYRAQNSLYLFKPSLVFKDSEALSEELQEDLLSLL